MQALREQQPKEGKREISTGTPPAFYTSKMFGLLWKCSRNEEEGKPKESKERLRRSDGKY